MEEKKHMIHNLCINSVEPVPEDRTILKVKGIVLDFEPTPNGWAISRDIVDQYKNTLVNKHIVTRYYSEDENNGIDALGNHEPSSTTLRGTSGEVEIPITETHSIGTVTNVYIDKISEDDSSDKEVLWFEGILLYWDNINECELLLEWCKKGIPILTSVEWYYTKSTTDKNGIEWILNPNFSALTVLNSEQRGDKPVIYGNYSCSHIEIMLNNDHYQMFNNAIMEDINIKENNKRSETGKMDNIFVKALNEISFGETRSKILESLSKQMTADEFRTVYISEWGVFDTYFVYEAPVGDVWKTYKINYTKTDDEVVVDLESKVEVERKQILVEVSDVQQVQNELSKANDTIKELNDTITTLKSDNATLEQEKEQLNLTNATLEVNINDLKLDVERLTQYENELAEIRFNENLVKAQEAYKERFAKHNGLEKFETEEVQNLIKETLSAEKHDNAVNQLRDMILECADNNVQNIIPSNIKGGIEFGHSLNNLKPKKNYETEYGFKVED